MRREFNPTGDLFRDYINLTINSIEGWKKAAIKIAVLGAVGVGLQSYHLLNSCSNYSEHNSAIEETQAVNNACPSTIYERPGTDTKAEIK